MVVAAGRRTLDIAPDAGSVPALAAPTAVAAAAVELEANDVPVTTRLRASLLISDLSRSTIINLRRARAGGNSG